MIILGLALIPVTSGADDGDQTHTADSPWMGEDSPSLALDYAGNIYSTNNSSVIAVTTADWSIFGLSAMEPVD